MTRLVLIHGRSQEDKDPANLKQEWIDAWKEGLKQAKLAFPEAADIKFPYYGNTLLDLSMGADSIAEVIVKAPKGTAADPEREKFILDVLRETLLVEAGQAAVDATDAEVNEKAPQNWGWVQAILEKVDKHVPGASAGSIAIATNDVYQYLENAGIRDTIESGVRQAFTSEQPMIIVSHSLGTVVAYNLLRREGKAQDWKVPLFVTLGSPLAVTAIRKKLSPIKHPSCVGQWVNAFDKRDVVALHPLDAKHFAIDPPIRNIGDVNNKTENRHGIIGYLDHGEVASLIHRHL